MAVLKRNVVLLLGFFSTWVTCSTAMTLPTHELDLTSSASSMHEDFTKFLTITCSFVHRPGSDFSMVTSLILSRSQNSNTTSYQPIATLTAVDGDHLVINDSLGADVTGTLTHFADSHVTFHWLYPSSSVEGRYKCQVGGINNLGQYITSYAEIDIADRSVDLDMVLAKVKTLEVIQDDVTGLLTAATTELQEMREKQNETREDFAQAIGTFRGHQYLLSRPTAWNTPVADVMCRTLGGYLVEVDDEDELQFVAQMLDDNNWTGYTTFGATDFGHQKYWTYLHSGKPAFLKWKSGSPRNGGNYDCLYSHKSYDWLMSDSVCVHATHRSVFLCEIE